MENKKMTYVQALEQAIAVTSGEVQETLKRMQASLIKKAESRKPTQHQTMNVSHKDAILTFLREEAGKKFRVQELLKFVPALALDPDMNSQRVSALLRALKDAGEVVRTEEKRIAYFSIAPALSAD